MYGRANGPKYLNEGITHVTYSKKEPEFSDEIKIKLPTNLTGSYHLLFTFFNVVTKQKKGKKKR